MSRRVKCLLISATVIIIEGCATAPHVPFEVAPRPVFTSYTDELWFAIPADAIDNIVADDLACKQYIKRTEERAKIHNGE